LHADHYKKEQQRVAVGTGNEHFISVRQVSSDRAALRRCTCGPPPLLSLAAAAVAAAATAALLLLQMILLL